MKRENQKKIENLQEKRKRLDALIKSLSAWENEYSGTVINERYCGDFDLEQVCNYDEFHAFLQLKLHLLAYFTSVKELGIERIEENHLIDEIERALRVPEWQESIDACYCVGWWVVPFWEIKSEPGCFIFDAEYMSEDSDDSDTELVVDNILNLLSDMQSFYTKDELQTYLNYNSDFNKMVQTEELYFDESSSELYLLSSKLLYAFENYADSLSCADKRRWNSHKLVKEIYELSASLSLFGPGSDAECSIHVAPGLYLYLYYDLCDGYNANYNYAHLNADLTAGLYANMVDLLILELDAELDFLPEEMKSYGECIFPYFRKEGCRATKVAM